MKALFKNCLRVEERDGYLQPLRFTENQMATYAVEEPKATRSSCPAAIMLAFRSTAKKLTLEYTITARARDWARFDVVCDGKLRNSVAVTEDTGSVEIPLSGDADVETHVYLPHLVSIKVRNISADEPLMPIEEEKRVYLALGDSITQGMEAHKPSCAYPVRIAERFGYELINAGVGGIKFNASQLDYIGREPDIITVALGCNDWGDEQSRVRENVSDYLERLLSLYKCRNIHLILPIWRNDEKSVKAGVTFAQHRQMIRSVASRYPFINIVDGYRLVPHAVEYFGDLDEVKLHPTEEGFALYAQELEKLIDFEKGE